jgi:hypothetical protein
MFPCLSRNYQNFDIMAPKTRGAVGNTGQKHKLIHSYYFKPSLNPLDIGWNLMMKPLTQSQSVYTVLVLMNPPLLWTLMSRMSINLLLHYEESSLTYASLHLKPHHLGLDNLPPSILFRAYIVWFVSL